MREPPPPQVTANMGERKGAAQIQSRAHTVIFLLKLKHLRPTR